jgi:carbon storage regulator CsrA
MLVLSRKPWKRVCIGDAIVLTVVALENGRVRLAFEAPQDVAIDRAEVRQRRQRTARRPPSAGRQG